MRLKAGLGHDTPMQPTLVKQNFHCQGWIYEEKIDGYPMLAYKNGKRVRL